MARKRWIVPNDPRQVRPIFYHCISRVVDRRFAFLGDDKEKFRMFMRKYENFTGCRVVSYCLMCNHIHLLVEVPPLPEGGFSDEELLKRLSALYDEGAVALVAKELADARELNADQVIQDIHERYSRRMHDLSRFMEGLLQRFTRWFNRSHKRSGNLWEDAFKSVIVEDGVAAKTISAYIDLNPVRAGMVKEPADYRWSSYGEAIGGGAKGDGKKARAGLVRALLAHKGIGADATYWSKGEVTGQRSISSGTNTGVAHQYRMILMAGAVEKMESRVSRSGENEVKRRRQGMTPADVERANEKMGEIPFGKMLRCRVRYFTEGAVIGSRGFVEDAFENSRARFSVKRKNGARRMRGAASPAAELLWSVRDLKKEIW